MHTVFASVARVGLVLASSAVGSGADYRTRSVLPYFLLDPDHRGALAETSGFSDEVIDGLVEIAHVEAARVAELRLESDSGLRESGPRSERVSAFNRQAVALLAESWERVAGLLGPEGTGRLHSWIAGAWGEDRAEHGRVSLCGREDPLAYTVFMTQYIGFTDYELALPDKYVKFANLGWEIHPGYENPPHRVRLAHDGYTIASVDVLDVGPWNIDDNYWNPVGHPERPRRLFTDLPQGMPEAQAAYYDNYNGGRDQYGRMVLNPAGADATPEVAADLGLAYLQNAWVEVTYLWEDDSGESDLILDNVSARTRGNWTVGDSAAGRYGEDYLWAMAAPDGDAVCFWVVQLPEAGFYDLYGWWSDGENRSRATPMGARVGRTTHGMRVDQTRDGGRWNHLATYDYPAGRVLVGVLNKAPAGSVVIADAMRLVRR